MVRDGLLLFSTLGYWYKGVKLSPKLHVDSIDTTCPSLFSPEIFNVLISYVLFVDIALRSLDKSLGNTPNIRMKSF